MKLDFPGEKAIRANLQKHDDNETVVGTLTERVKGGLQFRLEL